MLPQAVRIAMVRDGMPALVADLVHQAEELILQNDVLRSENSELKNQVGWLLNENRSLVEMMQHIHTYGANGGAARR